MTRVGFGVGCCCSVAAYYRAMTARSALNDPACYAPRNLRHTGYKRVGWAGRLNSPSQRIRDVVTQEWRFGVSEWRASTQEGELLQLARLRDGTSRRRMLLLYVMQPHRRGRMVTASRTVEYDWHFLSSLACSPPKSKVSTWGEKSSRQAGESGRVNKIQK